MFIRRSTRFYKEELAGERNNYIHYQARCTGETPIQILHKICEEVLDAVKTIRNTYQEEKDCKTLEAYNKFFFGYM